MNYDSQNALLTTSIPNFPEPFRGKVRDVYDLTDKILFVATDRISAFDCVMPNGVPNKGKVLTQLSLFWFKLFDGIVPNHLICADVDQYPQELAAVREDLRDRSMLVRKLKMLPVECIVRGYLAGSGWKEYQKSKTVTGIPLRDGYENCSKLDEPIFTPTTKEEEGHDMAINFQQMAELIGEKLAEQVRDVSIKLYKTAAEHALKRGIIIADTKFEFGVDENGNLVLADEVLTPDSSRFWPADSYKPGSNPPSLDKQFVRDWLDEVGFNHQPPAPALPADVVEKTSRKYQDALNRLVK